MIWIRLESVGQQFAVKAQFRFVIVMGKICHIDISFVHNSNAYKGKNVCVISNNDCEKD